MTEPTPNPETSARERWQNAADFAGVTLTSWQLDAIVAVSAFLDGLEPATRAAIAAGTPARSLAVQDYAVDLDDVDVPAYDPQRLRVEALLQLQGDVLVPELQVALADWIVDRAEEAYLIGQADGRDQAAENVRRVEAGAATRVLAQLDAEAAAALCRHHTPHPTPSPFEIVYPHLAGLYGHRARRHLSATLDLGLEADPS
jgi:hypothetical protein